MEFFELRNKFEKEQKMRLDMEEQIVALRQQITNEMCIDENQVCSVSHNPIN